MAKRRAYVALSKKFQNLENS